MAIVKIFRIPEWAAFRRSGRFDGSADDRRDGFLHLSGSDQAAYVLRRHFAGERRVVVAELDVKGDPALRFEPAGNGQSFPHLYRPLEWRDVRRHEERACDG